MTRTEQQQRRARIVARKQAGESELAIATSENVSIDTVRLAVRLSKRKHARAR